MSSSNNPNTGTMIYTDPDNGNKIITTVKINKNEDGSTSTASSTVNAYGTPNSTTSTGINFIIPSNDFIFA